jgi:hypothetical protein
MIWAAGAMLPIALWTGMSVAQAPAQGSGGALSGVRTIAVPNGGTIYLGVMAGQPTPEDGMGKVMQRVTALCGDRPQLGKLDKNTSGEILAGFFTVTGKNLDGKPMEGLAIVYAPKSGTAGGAVLMDTADRFPKSVNSMFARLKQELGAPPSSSGAPSSAGGSGTPVKAGSSAATAAPVKSGPPQPLQPFVFPDGTGVIGLPAGWQPGNTAKGDVSATGPHGEKLRFGWTLAIIDPTNPQSRALMGNSRGAAPGNFVAIPYGTDPANAYKAAFTQLAQKARKQPPAIDIAKVQDMPMQGGKNYMLYGHMDFHDNLGKQYLVAQMINTMPQPMGTWQMTLHVMYGPEQAMAAEAGTISEIFPSYNRDNNRLNVIVNTEMQQSIAITNNALQTIAQYNDSADRMTAGMSNMLRDQTVVVDTRTGGHATTSDDLAGALINANPSRFQSVSTSGYIPGIDY